MAATHIHSNAHHAVRGHPTTGRGDHRGDMRSPSLRVKVGSPAALSIQLRLGVVGIGCSDSSIGVNSLSAFSNILDLGWVDMLHLLHLLRDLLNPGY